MITKKLMKAAGAAAMAASVMLASPAHAVDLVMLAAAEAELEAAEEARDFYIGWTRPLLESDAYTDWYQRREFDCYTNNYPNALAVIECRDSEDLAYDALRATFQAEEDRLNNEVYLADQWVWYVLNYT